MKANCDWGCDLINSVLKRYIGLKQQEGKWQNFNF